MVWRLVKQLVVCPKVTQVIVTLNIPEDFPNVIHQKVLMIKNDLPKGFGANHNTAFGLTTEEFYCVINPDIELTLDPFETLISVLSDFRVGLVAPLIYGANGMPEDSMRYFLTPWSMTKRALGIEADVYASKKGSPDITPDWVAGMFMLFRSEVYRMVHGFDERYFMYCEDADICARLWKAGHIVKGCQLTSVIHNAQRASHRSSKHLSWHIQSMVRFFWSHSFSLPKKISLE